MSFDVKTAPRGGEQSALTDKGPMGGGGWLRPMKTGTVFVEKQRRASVLTLTLSGSHTLRPRLGLGTCAHLSCATCSDHQSQGSVAAWPHLPAREKSATGSRPRPAPEP